MLTCRSFHPTVPSSVTSFLTCFVCIYRVFNIIKCSRAERNRKIGWHRLRGFNTCWHFSVASPSHKTKLMCKHRKRDEWISLLCISNESLCIMTLQLLIGVLSVLVHSFMMRQWLVDVRHAPIQVRWTSFPNYLQKFEMTCCQSNGIIGFKWD